MAEENQSNQSNLLLSESAEVVGADFLPLAGIVKLLVELGVDLAPTLIVDDGLGLLPDADEILYLSDTMGIAVLQFLPKRASAVEPARPGHVVKPEQEAFRAGIHVVVERAVRLAILCRGVAAQAAAVEADAVLVGLVVVDGTPLDGIAGLEPIGLRPVVVVELEDVVQAQRHHIVDTGFATAKHEALQLFAFSSKRLVEPLRCNLL